MELRMSKSITRIGIGGPVGSGKTAIVEAITPRFLDLGIKVLIITNDVVTTEDAKHVQRTLKGVLLPERILGVETGACPHTAVREDPSMNLAAVEDMERRFPDTDVVLIESGGDNLTLTFSPALVDYFIYVIDVAAGDHWLISDHTDSVLQFIQPANRLCRRCRDNRRISPWNGDSSRPTAVLPSNRNRAAR